MERLLRQFQLGVICTLVASSALGQLPMIAVDGDAVGDSLGTGVILLPDVNGDLVPDFASCAQASSGPPYVRIYSGADGSVIATAPNPSNAPRFAGNLSRADYDGDGVAEVLISGLDTGVGVNAYRILPNGQVHGFGPGAATGTILAEFAGDANGDGYDDVLFIVAWNRIEVWAGGPAHSQVFVVDSPFQRGAAAGDVNKDGFDDVVLGDISSGDGRVVVYAGQSGSILRTTLGGPGDFLGGDVTGGFDLNNDGYSDFAATAKGYARAYSGLDGTVLMDFQADLSYSATIDGAGDLNADGVPDFLVGASAHGGVPATVFGVSGATGQALFELSDPEYAGIGPAVSGGLDVNGDAVPDFLVGTPSAEPNGHQSGGAILFSGTDCLTRNFCIGVPNTTGKGAHIFAVNLPSLTANNLGIGASDLPPNKFGIFFYGEFQTYVPFGDGVRCVTGALVRIFPVVQADAAGNAFLPLDLSSPPFSSGQNQVLAGSTWNFQLWYRDSVAIGAGYNFSDGLEIHFCK